ncbi:MAG: acyl-ACP--UDP-N-acetylglucosamine O-acyltransferase [Pararhodobacter sp.]|nr:acyl-ACP--UDP-N-acetylglucosamine O-acyltransferase [Pararhodobacter sp.]
MSHTVTAFPDARVDPLAVIAPGAVIGAGVEVGPFCRIGPHVVLEENVVLHSHVVIEGDTRIGAGTSVHPFTVLGGPPQHLRYQGERTQLEIGAGCDIREQVSVHRGTAHGGGVTRIGAGVMLMAQTHVGHDCILGDHVILAGNATLAGHVSIGDHAIIGGVSGIHQFVRIGARAFVGGCAAVPMDIIPFASAFGNHARLRGLNIVGLKRAGFSRETIQSMRGAYHALFLAEGQPFRARIDMVAARYADCPEVGAIIAFLRADANRPILPAARHLPEVD